MNNALLHDCRRLVISINHQLDSQERIDLAINKMQEVGITVVSAWSYDDIQEEAEESPKNIYPYITAVSSPFEDIESISGDEYEQLADKCLGCIDGSCYLEISKARDTIIDSLIIGDRFYKGTPCCRSSLLVHHQDGITFNLVKEVMERNGASNIVLNGEDNEWMMIDFEAPSIMINEFGTTYLNGLRLLYRVSGYRTDWEDYKKMLDPDTHWKVVEAKHSNYFDFSGDDLSIDPRLW